MTNNKDLITLIENFDDEPYTWNNTKSKSPIHSRISLKREPWAKTRPFAICDYFSQSALLGLHKYIFMFLESQVEDGTFYQDRVSEIVREWTRHEPIENDRVESADLTEATNRIPIEVQAEIIAQLLGNGFAMKWRVICSERNFIDPDGNIIKYNAGQPMGLLSSWGALALWHHIIVRSCLRYLGICRDPESPRYVVIGDDVSMKGSDLFDVYQEIVEVVQGVGISKSKGYHKDTQHLDNPLLVGDETVKFMHTAELAKRVFCNGQEITVVPTDEVLTSFVDPSQFPELLKSLDRRGYPELKFADLPALTSLCHHRRLALLLSTNPITGCAHFIGVTPPEKGHALLDELIWFQPDFDVSKFKLAFIKQLKVRLIKTLSSAVTNLNDWFKLAITEGEVKVKDWVYASESQGLAIFLVTQKCRDTLEKLMDEKHLTEVFPKGEINISTLRKYLGEMQTLFEVDLLFKEGNISRERSRKVFINILIAKVLRETVRTTEAAS
jgi:hypothetical protein